MTLTRRDFLLTSSAAAAAVLAGQRLVSAEPAPIPDEEPSLVFAHLTDMHIRPTGAGPEGLARCLAHVHAHPAKPSFILNGGDMIMSALGANEENTAKQWEKFHEILEEHNRLPMYHMIGNHDC